MKKNNLFAGCTIVVTGKLKGYTREGINCIIECLGAKAGRTVNKNTDYLICGTNPGSKLAKAEELGITILTEKQFYEMSTR